MVLIGCILGGVPARLIAAYCQSGPLDKNMQKAARELSTVYGIAAVVCTAGGVVFPPLLIVAPCAGALSALLGVMGQGSAPTGAQVANVTTSVSQAKTALGSPTSPAATQAAGQVGATWDEMHAAGIVDPKSEPATSIGSSTTCGKLEQNAKDQAAKQAAVEKAKARSKAKMAACIARGGHFDPKVGACVNPAVDAAKAKSKAKMAACVARGGHYDPKSPTGCSADVGAGAAPAPDGEKKSNALLYGALALAGLKVASILF